MSELPEPWNQAAEQAGIRQTLRGLADRSQVPHTTVRRLILGIGTPSASTIAKVSDALGVDVSRWVGRKATGDPYVGPDASRHLNERQRAALTELINALLDEEDETDAHGAEARKKTLPDMARLRAAAQAAWVIGDPDDRPSGASVTPLHPTTPSAPSRDIAARGRTVPRTPNPDLDSQEMAGEESQDAGDDDPV